MKSNIFLSVIIPVFNETARIDNLKTITRFFKKFNTEIIVINDGSTDKTLKILKDLQRRLKFKIVSYLKNKGKGYAVKRGVLASQGGYILLTDVDLSTPLSEFKKFLPHLAKNHIVIATRKHKKARVLKHQGFIRENLGRGFTHLSNVLLGLKLSDYTCGFKCFSSLSAKEIFKKTTIDRWGYDCEVLFIADKMGFKVKEVPVSWANDHRSKVKFPRDAVNSFSDLLRIRLNHSLKKY